MARARILVVDDEAAQREIIVYNLEAAGFGAAEMAERQRQYRAAEDAAYAASLRGTTSP